jgi:arginase
LGDRLGAADEGDAAKPLRPPERDEETGLIAYGALVEASRLIADAVRGALERGDRPFVLGGDCSFLIGVAAALSRRGDDVGLAFVDGHADYYDGASSPTGESADMDLAIVHGGGPEELAALGGPPPMIAPERTVILGHRSPDLHENVAEERARIHGAVRQIDAPEIRVRGAREAARAALDHLCDANSIWLHIDLDALDESDLPAVSYPQPGGISWSELEELIAGVAADPRLLGASLADFNPDLDRDGAYATRIAETVGGPLASVS